LTQKLIFITDSHERLAALAEKHQFEGGYWASTADDGRIVVAAYPRHHHTRFALIEEDGVIVLPAGHDSTPIGDAHKHLAHVDAKPHHTGRDVGEMLAARHGCQFHPDV
jgi:hypothetical protein